MSEPDLSSLTDDELHSLQAQIVQTGSAGIARHNVMSTHSGPETPEWQAKFGPLSGRGEGEQTITGIGQGMTEVGRQVGNLTGLESNEALQNAHELDQPLMNTGAGRFGSLAGESTLLAPTAAATSGLTGVPALLGSMGLGAGQGALMAGPGNRGAGALGGATAGLLFPAGMTAAQKLAYGLKRTAAAQKLVDAGVPLTPGQLNPSGPMNQFEQSAESIPGFKQVVEPARESAERSYQALVMQKAAAPGAPPIKPSENISDMLQQAQDSYAPLYNQAKGYPMSASSLSAEFNAASRTPGVPKSLQQSENSWLQDRLSQLPKNPQSDDLLQLRSDIRARARMANLKTDTDSGHVANINSQAEQAVTAQLNRQLPPAPLQALQTADSNYGNYKIVENAVARSKDNLAGLTPQKLSQAVYDATGDPAYAKGAGGPLRDLAKTGTEVFQNVSPPTGARTLTLGAAGLLGLTHPYIAMTGATGALGLTGTQLGRKLAAGVTSPQKGAQALAEALQKYSPSGTRQFAQTAFNVGAGPSLQDVPTAVLARAMASMHKPGGALVPQYREGQQ